MILALLTGKGNSYWVVRFQLRLYWQTADSSGFLRTGTRSTLIGKAGIRGGDSVDRAGHSMRGGLGDGGLGDGGLGDGGLGDDCAECGPRLRHLRYQSRIGFMLQSNRIQGVG